MAVGIEHGRAFRDLLEFAQSPLRAPDTCFGCDHPGDDRTNTTTGENTGRCSSCDCRSFIRDPTPAS